MRHTWKKEVKSIKLNYCQSQSMPPLRKKKIIYSLSPTCKRIQLSLRKVTIYIFIYKIRKFR